jgi:hypothetical protein
MASTPEPRSAASTPATTPSPATAPKPARPPATGPHQVAFVAYPKLLFVWPLILAGFVFWPLARPDTTTVPTAVATQLQAQQTGDAPATSAPTAPAGSTSKRLEWFGWIYIWLAVLVLLTLGVDVDRNTAAFWVLLVVALWVLGMWLHDVKGFTFFGDIYRWFGRLDVQYDRSLGLALSIVLLVPYIIMIGWGHFNDRWRITHNEFEHYSFGKMDDSLGRGAKTVRTVYPDVFELLLGLAGTLIVYSASGTKELRRVPHVMFLPFVRQRLNKILETTSVTAATTEDEEEEETNV